ncbi:MULTISPECIES: hypothetical protein [unclassified Nocardia]|uniref:hypothetical protein n=1 Tax=unclassified Nocardia TaxID=2637762 RepID=UPI001CE40703|nr:MULTISPECIES: hypothetical protein [unclassified Nocardia]
MASGRPVNRVTSKRKPAETAQRAKPRPAAARATRTRVSGSAARPRRDPEPAAAPTRRPKLRLPRPAGPKRSWFGVAALSVAAVLLGAFAVLAALRPGVDDSNKAFIDTKSTEEVKAAAENALKTIYSTDAKNVDGYKAALRGVLTGTMLAEFDKYADTTFSALGQAQVKADAKPGPTGVTMLTDDRAELLVNLVVSASKGGEAQPSATGPIIVRMQKVNGHWLASEIPDRPVLQAPPQ